MFPRLILCEEHPSAKVQLSTGNQLTLSIEPGGTKLEITSSCNNACDGILLIPYYGAYIMRSCVKPLKAGDVEYLQVLIETRRVLKLYEIQINKNKISVVSHLPDDTIFRGFVKTKDSELDTIFKRILKKLIRQYLQLSIPICCAIVKISTDKDIEKELSLKERFSHRKVNGTTCDMYFSPGRCLYVRKVGTRRFNVSLIFSITYSLEFLNIILELYDLASMIVDFRLGRIEKAEKSVTTLDLFSVSMRTSRSLSNFVN